jgi:TatD DNase family protein
MPRVAAVLIDSHCHIDLEQFDPDRTAVLERARAAGVDTIVIPGIDLAQNQQALRLAEQDEHLLVAVGVHPNSADQFSDEAIAHLRDLAAHRKVVAIGEIGLDYYWDKVAPEQQRHAFVQQLDLAAELGLPVIIHSREANADVADVLRTWVSSEQFRSSALASRLYAGVLHAFSGDLALAEEAYGWGFVLSLGGPVTFRNAHALHALVPKLRLDRLMLETDAPYLTPHPWRGQRNEPAHVSVVVEQLALLYGATPAEVAAATTAVAQRFFQVEDRFGADVTERTTVARV